MRRRRGDAPLWNTSCGHMIGVESRNQPTVYITWRSSFYEKLDRWGTVQVRFTPPPPPITRHCFLSSFS